MKLVTVLARDLVGLLGAGLVAYGVYLMHQPAGIITAGGLLLALSLITGRRKTDA